MDAADLPVLLQHVWYAVKAKSTSDLFYAATFGKTSINPEGRVVTHMHTLLMQTPAGLEVDHLNQNGLDNRRSNIRNATKSQNQRNKRVPKTNQLGVLGVCVASAKGKTFYQAYAREGNGDKIKWKRFPLTPEGLSDASSWVDSTRAA